PLTSVEPCDAGETTDEAARSEAGVSLSGVTVLVVEDEPDMRSMIRLILESHGARVIVSASAAEARDAIRQNPHVVVSDIRLPDADGYDLIREIRSSDQPYARTPAIALTAFARTEDRTRAIRAGFQSHIAKPFEATELVLTVASFADIIAEGGTGAPP